MFQEQALARRRRGPPFNLFQLRRSRRRRWAPPPRRWLPARGNRGNRVVDIGSSDGTNRRGSVPCGDPKSTPAWPRAGNRRGGAAAVPPPPLIPAP
eukprot:gene12530-biopygen32